MNNLDAISALVPASMKVQGFLDAAALVDIYPQAWPWSDDLEPLQTLVGQMVAMVGSTFPPECPWAGGEDQWRCLWGQYRLPTLKTPYFFNAPQLDMFEARALHHAPCAAARSADPPPPPAR